MTFVRQHDSSIKQLFCWYMVGGLMLLAGTFDVAFAAGSSGAFMDSTNNSKRMLVLLSIYTVSIGFLVLLPNKRSIDIGLHPLVLLIILMPLASVSWSISPELSGKRAIAHALTVIFVLAVASRSTMEEFFRAMMVVFGVIAATTFLLVFGAPGIGVSQSGANDGSWHGAFGHKANMGRISAMALAVAIFFPAEDRRMRQLRWFIIISFSIILIMTQSRIAWGTFGVALVAGMVFKIMQWKTLQFALRALMFLVAFGIAMISAALLFEPLILASGRDLTFSGRTNLWESAIAVAQIRHPVTGAGYGAFWTKSSAIEVLRYMSHWGHMPSHGHNGYVDAWLEMGYMGLATLILVTFAVLAIILRRINDPKNGPYWFIFLLLNIQFLAINLGGTISFKHSEIFWIMFIAPLLFRLHHAGAKASRKHARLEDIPRPDVFARAHMRKG